MNKEDPLLERARQVKRAHEAHLLAKANVLGVGIGFRHRGGKRTREIALLVMVEKKTPAKRLSDQDLIPSEIDGVPVDVLEVGHLSSSSD